LRLAFLHGSNDLYGASRVLAQDVELLRGMGHDVTVALPENGPLTEILEGVGARVNIEPLCVLRRVAGATGARVPVQLPSICRNADVTVLWTIALSSYLPALRLRRRRVLCSVHEILPGRAGRLLAAWTCVLSQALMVNSEATAKWLTRDLQSSDAQLAYPVAPPYDPLPRRSSESAPLQLLLMGRVNGHKGHLEAVRAVEMAREAGASAEITLLGGSFPGQEHHLTQLLAAIEVLPWATYGGEVADTRAFVEKCDVVLVPTNRPEPFGIVALEAWAAGRRVIASDQGGLLEATEMVEGITVPAADVAALSQAIVRATRDPSIRVAPARNAPAGERCTSAARAGAWRSALAEACAKPRRIRRRSA
jgi:glycosyltransferase involved in cell wall biosynthesis